MRINLWFRLFLLLGLFDCCFLWWFSFSLVEIGEMSWYNLFHPPVNDNQPVHLYLHLIQTLRFIDFEKWSVFCSGSEIIVRSYWEAGCLMALRILSLGSARNFFLFFFFCLWLTISGRTTAFHLPCRHYLTEASAVVFSFNFLWVMCHASSGSRIMPPDVCCYESNIASPINGLLTRRAWSCCMIHFAILVNTELQCVIWPTY